MANSRTRKGRKASWYVRCLALLGGTLAGWIAAEGFLAFLAGPSEELVFLNKDGSVQWDCYCTNPRGYFVERRGPDGRTIYCVDHGDDPPRVVDFSLEKYNDALKIMAIGDSFTWGLGVKLRDSYPWVLAERLAESTGREVVASNHGEVGRWVMEIYHGMRSAKQREDADLCIYGFVLNDPFDDAVDRAFPVGPDEAAAGMDSPYINDFINVRTNNLKKFQLESPLAGVRRHSRVVDLALRKWEWHRIHRQTLEYYRDLYDPTKNRNGLEMTWNAVVQMNQMQQAIGKKFLVVIFPLLIDVDGNYPFADIHTLLLKQFRALGIVTMDLLPIFARHDTESLCVHPLDKHPNEKAHRITAEAIGEFLLEHKLVGAPDPNQAADPKTALIQ